MTNTSVYFRPDSRLLKGGGSVDNFHTFFWRLPPSFTMELVWVLCRDHRQPWRARHSLWGTAYRVCWGWWWWWCWRWGWSRQGWASRYPAVGTHSALVRVTGTCQMCSKFQSQNIWSNEEMSNWWRFCIKLWHPPENLFWVIFHWKVCCHDCIHWDVWINHP